MGFLQGEDVLRLCSCSKELMGCKERELPVSVNRCSLQALFMRDVLSRMVKRPVPNGKPIMPGGIYYAWAYHVVVIKSGLRVCGDFADATGRKVYVTVIPHYKAEDCKHGWYEVCDLMSGQLIEKGTYAETVEQLLRQFRAHINQALDEEEAEEESREFHEAWQNAYEMENDSLMQEEEGSSMVDDDEAVDHSKEVILIEDDDEVVIVDD